jgi:RNA polymerase sigma-70 factor (ECF subfamily)
MGLDLDQHYEKIYKYCYFRLHNRDLAEDITQETFLRFFTSDTYRDTGQALQYLYTIARNLCIDEYRRPKTEELSEEILLDEENDLVINMDLRAALQRLSDDNRELIVLRYVSEVPIAVLCKMYRISRFALYRKIQSIINHLRKYMEDGEESE